jgi:hypothetical protein
MVDRLEISFLDLARVTQERKDSSQHADKRTPAKTIAWLFRTAISSSPREYVSGSSQKGRNQQVGI